MPGTRAGAAPDGAPGEIQHPLPIFKKEVPPTQNSDNNREARRPWEVGARVAPPSADTAGNSGSGSR